MHFFDCNDCARISCLQNATSSDAPIRDLADILITDYYWVLIKTHGSESRGQEEAACMRVFWPTRPLQ